MSRPQQVRDIPHRLEGEQPQHLGLDLQKSAAGGFDRLDALGGDQAVGRGLAAGGLVGQ
jgi:hypothetical protein